jgi:hypothetical protein
MNNFQDNLLDKHGKPLRGAALQSRLTAIQKQQLHQTAREYVEKTCPDDWTHLDVEDKVQVLLAIDDLITDCSVSSSIQTIEINEGRKTQIKWSDLAIFQVIKSAGYLCAISGGMVLLFMFIRGGEMRNVEEASGTFGMGITLVKFCYDQEKNETLDNNS